MKKITMTGIAAALALGSSMVMAAQGATSPYGVQPGEVLNLNKAPSADDIAKICENKAAYRNLSGAERDSFLSSCKQDV